MKLVWWIRVTAKMLRRRVALVPAFCKRCGRDVHDFVAPDDVWAKVEPLIPRDGHVVCYDCFCELAARAGSPSVYHLVPSP